MRAVVQDRFGGPEVLEVREMPRPEPIPTEILVRVHAAGLNPVDWKTRSGMSTSGDLSKLPLTVGWDVSGVVEEVGFGVTTVAPGDEVYGMPWFPRRAGGYGEFVTAPTRQFATKPATLSHEQAAAVPLAGLTAWQTLVDTAHVGPGDRVLIHAAAGGVGHLAVQIAKHFGAQVTATASARNHQWLYELGADEVVDYTATRFEEVVDDVDVVLDSVGDELDATSTRSLEVVRPGGLLIAIPSGVSAELAATAASLDVRVTPFLVEPDGHALATIGDLIDAGTIKVEVETIFALEQIAEAHRQLQTGRTRGKLVVRIRG